VLALLFVSPLYAAVIELVPAGSVLVLQVALPPESVLVLQPERFVQVMLPVTVQVIDWPYVDAFGVQPVIVVVVLSWFTVWLTEPLVPVWFESPE
jgi:hypothetical protein